MWPFKKKKKISHTIGLDIIGNLLVLTGDSGIYSTSIMNKDILGEKLHLHILYFEGYKNRIAALAGHDRAVMMARDMIKQNKT